MRVKISIWHVLGLIVLIAFIVKQCEQTKVVTKTVTKTEVVRDTIREVKIGKPKIVYIDKEKKIYKDTIIYKDKEGEDSIKANQYKTKIQSNEASADLQITTTGELLDVSGTIKYPKTQVVTTITELKESSGVFLYLEGNASRKPERVELGIDYQIRNKLLIGISTDYNSITKKPNLNIKLGIRIF